MKKQLAKTRFAVPVLTAMVMAACNGGGDLAGIGGSGFISTGTVTGFGSVYVNGVKFETDQARFEVEGLDGTQADLRVGMVVQVEGSVNADGNTGTASFIRYADDLQGPVSAIDASDPDLKRLTVLGQTVVISAADTSYDGLSYDTITTGQLIEVSGFYDQNGDLQASYIELKDANDDIEIRGVIENLNGFEFTVRGLAVDASSAVSIEGFADGQLQEGVYVEVEGSFDSNTNTLIAREIEVEDDLYNDDDEVEIEGYITSYTDINNFEVNGIPVDASNISATLQLSAGIKIEVEGSIVNGVLVADEIELRGGNAEISARVDSVNVQGNSFTMAVVSGQPSVTVQISSVTRMEDDAEGSDDNLLLSELQMGDFIDVLGFEEGVSTVAATRVKREAEIKDTELQGVVTAHNSGSVTVLGVNFQIDGTTEFEMNDVSLDINSFLDRLTDGETVISIEDKVENGGPDGVADSVEIED